MSESISVCVIKSCRPQDQLGTALFQLTRIINADAARDDRELRSATRKQTGGWAAGALRAARKMHRRRL